MTATPPDPRSPKSLWDEQHKLLANEPVNWLLKADSLMAAFEALAADDETAATENRPRRAPSVQYMLAGFAFENLFKGLLVVGKHPFDEKGRFDLKTHDLLTLSDLAGYAFSKEENSLLERLQEFSTWAGRYPVPLSSEPMRPRRTESGGFAPRTFGQLGQDWGVLRQLFSRVRSDLQAKRNVIVRS